MNMTPGWPRHVDGSVSPVILPIGSPRDSGWETPQGLCQAGGQPATQVRKFTFPAIPPRHGEWSLDGLPYAIWPKCDCTEAVQAGRQVGQGGLRPIAVRSSVGSWRSPAPATATARPRWSRFLAPELASRTSGGALAVDADFRKSDLTARLAIPATANSAGSSLIYPTDLAGLNVLPMSRHRRSRGADAAWIEEMRESWPLMILDMASLRTPPRRPRCCGIATAYVWSCV